MTSHTKPIILTIIVSLLTAMQIKQIRCQTNLTSLTVRFFSWTDYPPYYIPNHARATNGMVPQAIKYQLRDYIDGGLKLGMTLIDNQDYLHTEQELFDLIQETNKTKILERLNTTTTSSDIFVVQPTTKYRECKHFQRVPIFVTDEAIIFVRKSDVFLLRRFMAGISRCLGVIVFAVISAINVAAVIWAVEKNTNPEFNSTFGKGLWISFWYCFVTMTTVGYGDKVPKNFFSRLLCLIWMLFGVMLTAIITASIIETVQNEIPKANKKIAISPSRLESSLVINKLAGNPIEFPDYHAIIDAVRTKKAAAGLLDVNVAAYIFARDGLEDLTMESTLKLHKEIFAYIYHNEEVTNIKFHFDDKSRIIPESEIIRVRGIYVPAYKVSRYYARTFIELFQREEQDDNFVFYIGISSAVLVALGIISEIYVIVNRIWVEKRKKKDDKSTQILSTEMKMLNELEELFDAKVKLLKTQLCPLSSIDSNAFGNEITIDNPSYVTS